MHVIAKMKQLVSAQYALAAQSSTVHVMSFFIDNLDATRSDLQSIFQRVKNRTTLEEFAFIKQFIERISIVHYPKLGHRCMAIARNDSDGQKFHLNSGESADAIGQDLVS